MLRTLRALTVRTVAKCIFSEWVWSALNGGVVIALGQRTAVLDLSLRLGAFYPFWQGGRHGKQAGGGKAIVLPKVQSLDLNAGP